MKKQIILFLSVLALFSCFLMPVHGASDPLRIFNHPDSYPIHFEEGAQPFINDSGRTMVPASSIDSVFQGGIQYTIENDTVTIIQTGLEYTVTVKLTIGSTTLYKNGEPVGMDSCPILKDGQLYIPLRSVGAALGHQIYWDSDLNQVSITYASAQIFVWNEDKDSSEAGLHYAIFQGSLKEKDLYDIYDNSTTDFAEIEALFDRVPKGDIHLCFLYPHIDYEIPDEKAEQIKELIISYFGSACSVSTRLMNKVPLIIQGINEYADKQYSEQLTALGEKRLKYSPANTYRFTYLRSFDNPLSIRIEIAEDGTGHLTFSMCERFDDKSFEIVGHREGKDLTKQQVNTFLQQIKDNDFWNLPMTEETEGVEIMDGSHWIIEGVSEGKYQLVDRHSPKDGAVYELGNLFLSLYGEDIGRKY